MIYKSTYKNVNSVVVDTGKITAVFLPTEGGKMTSLKRDGEEFLVQNASKEFLHLDLDGEFENTECAGFDDMFPTIDPTIVKDGSRKGLLYNDHGEVSRLSFDYSIAGENLVLTTRSNRLNYVYTKRISASSDGGLTIDYEIENLSDDDFNCIWAGHALVKIRSGGEIVTPFKEGDEVDLVGDKTQRFGKKGDSLNLKREMLTFGKDATNSVYKLYFPSKIDGGVVEFRYSDKKTLTVQFSDALKCLGLWIDDGLFKNYRCVGIEPCTRGYDTIYNAQEKGQYGGIKGNDTLKFSLKLNIK